MVMHEPETDDQREEYGYGNNSTQTIAWPVIDEAKRIPAFPAKAWTSATVGWDRSWEEIWRLLMNPKLIRKRGAWAFETHNGFSLLSFKFFWTHFSQACTTSGSAWRRDALYARKSWESTASWEALRTKGMWAPREISHLYNPNPRKLLSDKNLLHSLTSLSPRLSTWNNSVGLSNCRIRSFGSLVECRNHPMTIYGLGTGMIVSTCLLISSRVASTRLWKTGHCPVEDREWLSRLLDILRLPLIRAARFGFVSDVWVVLVTNSGCWDWSAGGSEHTTDLLGDISSSIMDCAPSFGWGVRPRCGVFASLTRLFCLSASKTLVDAFFKILFLLAIK